MHLMLVGKMTVEYISLPKTPSMPRSDQSSETQLIFRITQPASVLAKSPLDVPTDQPPYLHIRNHAWSPSVYIINSPSQIKHRANLLQSTAS